MNPNAQDQYPRNPQQPSNQPPPQYSGPPGHQQGPQQPAQPQQNPFQPQPNLQAPARPPQTPTQQAMRELKQTIGNSHEILVTAKTVFPFTLFPDTVTVDRNKLTITHRTFFSIAEVMSINIEDVLNVTANVGPFFGSLKITTRFFDVNKPYEVNMFWREDALRIKRILQGHIIAAQKQIDTTAFDTQELAKMLDELGKGSDGEKV